ncbi:hypothetical protein [Rickettsia asembonensis]|nr:hypothetical protein [Rickettsia asembonensis]
MDRFSVIARKHCCMGHFMSFPRRRGLVAWLLCHSRESGNPEKKV